MGKVPVGAAKLGDGFQQTYGYKGYEIRSVFTRKCWQVLDPRGRVVMETSTLAFGCKFVDFVYESAIRVAEAKQSIS